MRNLHNRSFVKELDFTADELRFLLRLSQAFDSDVRLAGPRELWPPDDVVATANELADRSGLGCRPGGAACVGRQLMCGVR
jgi:ornithine carbamoyltransferase